MLIAVRPNFMAWGVGLCDVAVKMPVATHEISLHGVSGAIFWFILSALVFYVLGFATVGWEKHANSDSWVGLWMTCSGADHHYYADKGR